MRACLFPWIVVLEPGEQIVVRSCTSVSVVNGPKGHYIVTQDELTGVKQVIEGPTQYFLGPFEDMMGHMTASRKLEDTEYLRVKSTETAEVIHIRGPRLFTPSATQEILSQEGAVRLTNTQYLRVKDITTGELRLVFGPQLFFPGEHDDIIDHLKAIALKQNQFIRLVDKKTGAIRVERGESLVYLGTTEEILENVSKGIDIDDDHAVVVRGLKSGQLKLVTEHQVFIPSASEKIEEVQTRIILEEYHVCVVKEKDGSFTYRYGSDETKAFFLQPHTELLTMRWSSGLRKESKNLQITLFDTRPKFMWYEFEARTSDNVEIILSITFFWVIADIVAMVKTTDDAVGDICSHARSVIIQTVSQHTLEDFLKEFNHVVRESVLRKEDKFYSVRGANIIEVEVRSVSCKDPATQKILQEIIQENTNRINRLMQQESENDVDVKKVEGSIKVEKMKEELLNVREVVVRKEGEMAGVGESARVKQFMEGLGKEMPLDTKISLFKTLQKHDALNNLSRGKAHLYLTPADIDLRIVDQSTSK